MMIYNGVDLVYLPRFEKSLENPRFITRFFGEEELKLYEERGRLSAFLGGNFAAKEAFSKSIGTGVRGFRLAHLQVLRNQLGAPYFYFSQTAKELAEATDLNFSLSISHHQDYAIAMVTAWRKD